MFLRSITLLKLVILQCILIGMKLTYRSTDKAVERREHIKELEAIDKEHVEKLLDIKRKFKDVRVSMDDLIKKLQTFNRLVKEGTEMMMAMVERFNMAKAENML